VHVALTACDLDRVLATRPARPVVPFGPAKRAASITYPPS
jgi:hypothetical protein